MPSYAGAKSSPSASRKGYCRHRRDGRQGWTPSSITSVWRGRPAAGFAKRLMLPVSKDTLLRVVRRRSRPPTDPLRVIGIDDWAWRRNHRYASIICNLERRRVVTLLPDREPATAQAWLAAHPTISIVARDRGGGYGEATAKALPHAVQVADRWHLMENASRAFLDALRQSMCRKKRANTKRNFLSNFIANGIGCTNCQSRSGTSHGNSRISRSRRFMNHWPEAVAAFLN
jgi:transposase